MPTSFQVKTVNDLKTLHANYIFIRITVLEQVQSTSQITSSSQWWHTNVTTVLSEEYTHSSVASIHRERCVSPASVALWRRQTELSLLITHVCSKYYVCSLSGGGVIQKPTRSLVVCLSSRLSASVRFLIINSL